MRISDWSSDVCSSDLERRAAETGSERAVIGHEAEGADGPAQAVAGVGGRHRPERLDETRVERRHPGADHEPRGPGRRVVLAAGGRAVLLHRHPPVLRPMRSASGLTRTLGRSEEHTSELQSLMRISYAVFCWKKKTRQTNNTNE